MPTFLPEMILNIFCEKKIRGTFCLLIQIPKPSGTGAIGQQHCRQSSDPEPPTHQTSFFPHYGRPLNSSDLNPADYKVWSVMKEQVYPTSIHDVNDLKQRLLDVWAALDQRIIDYPYS